MIVVAGSLLLLAGCASQPAPHNKDALLLGLWRNFGASAKDSGNGPGLFKSVAQTWTVSPKGCEDLAAGAVFGPWGFGDAQTSNDFGVVDDNVTIPSSPSDAPIAGDQKYSVDARLFPSEEQASAYMDQLGSELQSCPRVESEQLINNATFQTIDVSTSDEKVLAFESSTLGQVAFLQDGNIVVWLKPKSGNSDGFSDAVKRFALYMHGDLKYG
jgi:hypothetical protein